MKRTHHATFEKRKHTFNAVRVNVSSELYILARTMLNERVTALECLADWSIVWIFVSNDPTGQICVLHDHFLQAINRKAIHRKGTCGIAQTKADEEPITILAVGPMISVLVPVSTSTYSRYFLVSSKRAM